MLLSSCQSQRRPHIRRTQHLGYVQVVSPQLKKRRTGAVCLNRCLVLPKIMSKTAQVANALAANPPTMVSTSSIFVTVPSVSSVYHEYAMKSQNTSIYLQAPIR